MKCPQCDEECDQDEVDVGVGIIYGPPRCNYCGWDGDKVPDLLSKIEEYKSIQKETYDKILKEAQKTVQPIIDKEKVGEKITSDIMEFRMD